MARIRILPNQLVNKIAAGEVVERPASVVKELLENAIDAGAQRIDLSVQDGGKRLIQVTDDGVGMSREDLSLAWTAHATSKLNSTQDLFAITTMGFRGEALASISSISRGRIVSRTAAAQAGYELSTEAGQTDQPKPTPAPVGTTVQVRDLFYNVPVRRKFLRTTTTEMSHITEQLTRVALAHPQVHFTLTHNDRKGLDLPPTDSSQGKIASLFGSELAQTLLEAHSNEKGVAIQAFLGPPDMSRTSAKWQYFFLNGRYIRDRFIQHAVREAYRGLIEPNRFPLVFLYLRIDPEMVDINVHPTKIEVRFRDSNTVHSQVLSVLRERFLTSDLSSRMSLDQAQTSRQQSQSGEQVRQALADFIKSSPPGQPISAFGPTNSTHSSAAASQPTTTRPGIREELNKLFEGDRRQAQTDQLSDRTMTAADPSAQPPAPRAAALAPVLQVHRLYLVTETDDGLLIIDQHALHERIIYEKLSQGIRDGKVPSQQLLMPMPIELTPQQKALLDQAQDALKRAGIELVDFGPQSLAVQAFPALLDQADPAAIVQDIVDRLADMPNDSAAEQILEQVIASLACKAAVKAGDKLSQEEIAHLLANAESAERSSSCPHGRPTTLKLSLAELEKQFKRT